MNAMTEGALLGLSLLCFALNVLDQASCLMADVEEVFPNQVCEADICYRLRHVTVVHRHSARAPIKFLENDAYVTPELYPRGVGRITVLGMQQALDVGRLWRSWWRPQLLSGDAKEVFARVSHVERCYETTNMLLFEILSPGMCHKSQLFCVPYEPVPIIMPTVDSDKNVPDLKTILNLTSKVNLVAIMKTPVPKRLGSRFRVVGEFMGFVMKQVRKFASRVNDVSFFTAVIEGYPSNQWEGYPLPQWATQNWPVWIWARELFYGEYLEPQMHAYGSGVAADVAQILRRGATEGQKIKLALFGYHDMTISSLMFAIDPSWDRHHRPNFLSSIFFELYQEEKYTTSFTVRVRYSEGLAPDGRFSPLKVVRVKGCGRDMCDFEQLLTTLNASFTPPHNQSISFDYA